jgi:hypothetical protein
MLRKMVFGSRGRLSTDIDFTCRTDIDSATWESAGRNASTPRRRAATSDIPIDFDDPIGDAHAALDIRSLYDFP